MSHDGFDVFDAMIVVFSLVEILIQLVEGDPFGSGGGAAKILRLARILRALKTMKIIPALRMVRVPLITPCCALCGAMFGN